MNIAQIKFEIEEFGSDSLEVVGGKFEGGIHLQQISDELAPCILDIMELKERNVIKDVRNFLEIGSAAGGNAFIFNHFFNFERMVLIDDNKHKKHGLRESILNKINYDIFIGDSHSEEARKFVADLGLAFDILFVDGDHSHNGVKKDIEQYAKFVNYQGFIVLHDTVACPGVRQYAEEMLEDSNLDLKRLKEYLSIQHPIPCGITLYQNHHLPVEIWEK